MSQIDRAAYVLLFAGCVWLLFWWVSYCVRDTWDFFPEHSILDPLSAGAFLVPPFCIAVFWLRGDRLLYKNLAPAIVPVLALFFAFIAQIQIRDYCRRIGGPYNTTPPAIQSRTRWCRVSYLAATFVSILVASFGFLGLLPTEEILPCTGMCMGMVVHTVYIILRLR